MTDDYKNRYDEAEEPEETTPDKSKFEGFHFTRLSAVVILTFIILVAALIIDSLSTYHKVTYDDAAETSSCRADGDCGWRKGNTNWVGGGMSKCPADDGTSKTISFDYETLCEEESEDACLSLDAGNVYLIFTIFAIIFNLFTICIIVPLYCREYSIFPCQVCNTKTRWFLIGLFTSGIVCNLIAICVWMAGGPDYSGLCDNADPNYDSVFRNDDTSGNILYEAANYPSYSIGGLMLVLVANIVVCGAVTCCWGDNREYGDEMDEAKRQRQKEREYR